MTELTNNIKENIHHVYAVVSKQSPNCYTSFGSSFLLHVTSHQNLKNNRILITNKHVIESIRKIDASYKTLHIVSQTGK